jgi:hypothetical protein
MKIIRNFIAESLSEKMALKYLMRILYLLIGVSAIFQYRGYIKPMFYIDDVFQVSSLSALVVVIALGVSWRVNNKTIKANIVSKSRIEWIQKVREESANFISSCSKFIDYSDTYDIKVTDETTGLYQLKVGTIMKASITLEKKEAKAKLKDLGDGNGGSIKEKLRGDINRTGSLLILYFGPDNSNNNDRVVSIIQNIMGLVNNDTVDERVKKLFELFIDEIRTYLKVEWKRSIGELADFEVDFEINKLRNKANNEYSISFTEDGNVEYNVIEK